MMPHHENETRRRIMRPGFYSQMRRRLSASQTLSDLAAAASSQLEAENAAAAAAGTSNESLSTSHREDEREEPSRERLTNMRTSTPRRSRYSRYPPDHAYIRSSDPETLNLQRRGSSPFTHSPESSFVEVPGSSGDTNNSRSSAFMEVVYSNPDRSSRFQQYRSRRLRERLTRRQSIYSRMDDIRSSRDSHLNPSTSSDRSNFGYRRIDEWAVNRRLSLARLSGNNEESSNLLSEGPSSSNETGDATAPTDTSDNALNLSIRSQVDLSVLGRHIEHMQRICQTSLRYLSVSRQRRQILRLQAIRMMLEDLQNQIRNLRESTLERPDSLTNQSTSNNALAMSITRRLHVTREGLNRAMRRLNRSTNYTLTSRRTNPSRSSSVPPSYSTQARYSYNCMSRLILSRLRATIRAMEMSPDLSHSGYNNSVNELIAEESLAVLERTESTTNGENSSRNALRAMSQRLERLIRDNREASNNVNNFDNLIPEDTSPEAVPRSSNDNQSPQEEQANNNDDPTISLSSEGQQRNWSHLLDHGGYARQPRETSSDSEGDAEILQQRGVGRRRWRLFQEEQNSEEVNDEESLELLNWMPSPGFNRRLNSVRNMRDLGRASMRERLDSRAEYRRDWERARQRLSRARMIFHQRREREMGESSSGGASNQSSPQVDNWVLRYLLRRNMQLNALEDEIGELNVDQQRQPLRQLQQSQQQRPLHREILSWMVDQLTIDQQGNSGRAEAGEPGLPPGAVLPPPVPESIYRRRRASFYFRNHESGEAGPHNGFPNVRDNYFQQLRNHNFSATHRLQIWDFNSKSTNLPDIGDRTKNIIVEKAKIYNDASVDISSDGNILVTFCSSSLPMTPIVGVYGCSTSNLGICYATYSLESTAVSVSLSPTNRHLLVGVSTKSERMDVAPLDRSLMAQVFKIHYPWDRKAERGRLVHHRDIHHSPEHGYIGLNCIRWIPNPGQVYGTNHFIKKQNKKTVQLVLYYGLKSTQYDIVLIYSMYLHNFYR
ncbi:uncharacterized protein [Lepeophtheirus salmonis]|uniref:uncharacterized protein isoform X1 n=1 Tax=Lepeophtheirus salmonis TaxID=72036 RepID=UPI003AF3B973